MARGTAYGGAFWLAAAAGLGAIIAVEVNQDLPLSPSVNAAAGDEALDVVEPAAPPVLRLPSADLIDTIIERPLFSPSRRPDEVAPAEAVAVGDDSPLPDLELVGTMRVGDQPVALVRHPADGLLRLRPGQAVGDWTITAIEGLLVRFEQGEQSATLRLRGDQQRPAKPGTKATERNPPKPAAARPSPAESGLLRPNGEPTSPPSDRE